MDQTRVLVCMQCQCPVKENQKSNNVKKKKDGKNKYEK